MVYSRKMLQNDERREQIAKELEGVTWQMKIRSVADTYVFFEHPDFKDHVFCSASIIPSRPLTVGEMMNVEVELAYDHASGVLRELGVEPGTVHLRVLERGIPSPLLTL